MSHRPIYQPFLSGCIITLLTLLSAQAQETQRVLFVGNSYTYFWNLPQNVQAMAQSNELPISTYQSTAGGANWGQHWRGEKELQSVSIIEQGTYDAIVLQNHSMRTIEAPDSVFHYGRLLTDLAREQGAEVYLYVTWARQWDPYMQVTIDEVYGQLADSLNLKLVPVGPAWQRALELRPDLPLYDEDASHPSSLGTYLTACVFYGILSGQSPIGLPHRLESVDEHGEHLYLNIQSAENALFCQKVAEEVIRQTSH